MSIVKKLKEYIKNLIDIIKFCVKLSVTASPKYFIIISFINLITIVMPFISIFVLSRILNLLSDGLPKNAKMFVTLCVISCIITLVNKANNKLINYCDGLHREIMNKHIKYILMKKSSELELKFFDSVNFYDEMSDANNNSSFIVNAAFQSVDFLRSIVQLIFASVILTRYNFIYTILIIFSIIPSVVFQKKQLDVMYSLQRKNLGQERKLYYISSILFSKNYVKDVKLFNLFPFLNQKFNNIWNLIFKEKRKLSKKYTILLILTSFLPEILTFFITVNLGFKVLNKIYTIGDYSYYQGIVSQVLEAMFLLVLNYGYLIDNKMRIQNFIKFINLENKMINNGTLELNDNKISIEFKNVSFKYDDNLPYVLKNINFKIETPQKVALVGVNGSGKTTIIKLIMRFYDPSEGVILLNGKDIREYTTDSVKKCFSTMFQDYSNYAFTIKDAITLSDYSSCENIEKLNNALEKSGAKSFVSAFENGYNTYLTRQFESNGVDLSGGQWQKISIARTFFRESPFYILDEPSASLDAEAEDELFKQCSILYKNKGAILVSHRLSNVRLADYIIVIDNSEIIEYGTHTELMQKKGKYFYLYKLQADKYNDGNKNA